MAVMTEEKTKTDTTPDKEDLNYKIEIATQILDRNIGFITNCDNKSSIVLASFGVLLAIILTNEGLNEIFNIVNANIKEDNSKQINDIKSKRTKFKNSLKETKEQLEENLYQKLKQFSITYDRSLINEYFADFQVK